jgi:hypothetical protein
MVRSGLVRDEIAREMRAGGHDLLVLGAPLPDREGGVSLRGLVGQMLAGSAQHLTLIVRSGFTAAV